MLHDTTDLMVLIKKIAANAIEAGKPTDYFFGKVLSKSPLKISVEQKIILDSAQLILTRNVTEFETEITIEGKRHKIKVHNELDNGEEVILLRQKGGQKFLVLDRVVKT